MRRVISIATLVALGSCELVTPAGDSVRKKEVLCEKDGVKIIAIRPSDEVLETANRIGLTADIQTRGEDLVTGAATLDVTRKLERIREENPALNALELKLYLYGVSYCSGGLTKESYQRLVTAAHEAHASDAR